MDKGKEQIQSSTAGPAFAPRWWGIALALGIFAGALAIHGAEIALGTAAVLIALYILLSLLLRFGNRLFWSCIQGLLIGYLFLGKGFAYLGKPPIFIGELGLLVGVLAATITRWSKILRRLARRFLNAPGVLLSAFLLWQTTCTAPFLRDAPADTLRNAALWGYAAFAILINALLPGQVIADFRSFFGRLILPYLVWLPLVFIVVRLRPDMAPRLPGSSVALVHLKSGEVGVHLGGIAAYLLLRLDRGKWPQKRLWPLWALWGLSWVAYGVSNRGGMLSALLGLAVVLIARPRSRWDRPLTLLLIVLALLWVTGVELPLAVGKQDLSFEQIIDNFLSLIGKGSHVLEGTKQWRLQWWTTIVHYTFGGPYFWRGKGYGINLADDDGFQVTRDHSLRSPHNVSMTILARSGVPGLLLWFLFLASLGARLSQDIIQHRGPDTAAVDRGHVSLWLLAYWLAFLLNASVDVFLEGPMGGIWFWCITGFAIIHVTNHTRENKKVDPPPQPHDVATRD